MHSSAPLVAVGRGGECIRVVSGEGGPVSLLATDRVCSVKLSSCAGVAYRIRPMRGDIDGLLSAACSWSLERILQAFFATQVEAFVYFMMVILQCAPLASWRALAGLWCCCMQVGGYRPQLRPHRGVN